MKKILPYLLLLLGLIILILMGQAAPAGICILLGIVWAIETIWPEKWDIDQI